MRSRRPIEQAGLALGVEAGDPAMRALARDPHRLGDMRDRHPLLTDPMHQQTTTMERQTSVTVRHEDLRVCEDGNLHSTGGLRFRSTTVTNVPAEYI